MKKYVITDCPNEFVKSVSVAEEEVEGVIKELAYLSYVDGIERFPGRKTQIQVVLSEAVEPSDLEEMEEVIRQLVEDNDDVS